MNPNKKLTFLKLFKETKDKTICHVHSVTTKRYNWYRSFVGIRIFLSRNLAYLLVYWHSEPVIF